MAKEELPDYLKKIPPANVEAERAVLGGMLLEPEILARVLGVLRIDDFYVEKHRKIFTVIGEMFSRSEAVDLLTLVNEMDRQKIGAYSILDDIGGAPMLAGLVEEAALSSHVLSYVDIVVEKASLRDLIRLGTQMIGYGFEAEPSADVIERTERGILKIFDRRLKVGARSLREALGETFERLEMLSERKEAVTGVPSGFVELDKLTSGFQPGNLVLIAGRPSMGKTAVVMDIVRYAATQQQKRCLVFSLEMATGELVSRLLCAEAQVDSQRVRTGFLSPFDWTRLTEAAGRLSEAPIWIDDSPSLTPLEIRSKARRIQMEGGLDLVVVDYLQLMRGTREHKQENEQQEISGISRAMKALAKELNIPVIALSQLSRAVESREKKEPMLSDLRSSGSLEQDADVVLFLYRPERYGIASDDDSIIIGKQRNGPTGRVPVVFIPEYASFKSYSPREEAVL